MALDDKDILITPNTGSANEPKIEFVGADASGNDTITLSTSYDGTVSTLSFEASSGQLFSVANVDSDGDGYLFAVNDKSGIPSLQVEVDGTVILNPNVGNVIVGTSTDDGSNVFQVSGNSKLTGDVSGITDLYIDDQIISTGDTNTYFQFHAADQMRMVAGGTERLEITNVSPHVLVTGNLKVQGNIEATGTLDTTGQNDLAVTDRKITLNDGETASGVNGGTGGELAVSGIFIDRGQLDSASFIFDEVDDKWKARLNSAFDTPALATFAAATLEGNLNWSYIQSKPDPVVTVELSGDVTGSGNATLTDLGNGTVSLTTTIAANSVALGTDTTGAYVADIVQGNAISISETANNAEGNVVTINHADTSSVGNLSSDNANGVVLQDISFTFDTYGHTTAASVATTDLDSRYIRSFQVEDGDGTEVAINQANEWKFVEGAGDGATIDINWTDTTDGSDGDPYDLTFSVTNTDKGSSQNIFKTFTVDDTDTEYTWATTGSAVADTNSDTLTFVSGNDFDVDVDADLDAIRFQHVDITRTDTTSSASPTYGGTFSVIDSLTTNARGHVTAANVKTVTVPASDNTNTTYDLSIIQTGGDNDNPAIRLAAGGSGSGNDDLTLTGGGAITITRTSDTGVTIDHTDTSTQASVDNSGNTFIQDITLDTYGHVTGLTSATTSIGDATITLSAGTDLGTGGAFTTNQTGNETITFNHSDITRTDTTSTDAPAYGGTFEAVTSVTSSARGHITAIDVSTITIPASDNTDTTYSISTVAGGDGVSEKIRLTAGGSGSGTDDIILAVAQTGSTDGLDISESGDTITFAHHDTSTLTGQQGTAGIANITVDEMGHVTAVGTATYNNYVHPSYTARTVAVNTSGVQVLDTLNITVDTIGSVTVANAATRTLPSAGSSTTGVVTSAAQTFGGKKTFANGIELTNGATAQAIEFHRDEGVLSITAGEVLGDINFYGTDENIKDLSVRIRATAYNEWNTSTDISDAPGELSIWVVRDGTDTLYETLTINQAEVVVNEGSQDVNFRVESNTNTNALFVDGGTGHVGVGGVANSVADLTVSASSPIVQLTDTAVSSDWDVGDTFGIIQWNGEGNLITRIESRQTLENQIVPYGGFVVATGTGSNTPERMVIDHNGCITMVAGGTTASSTLNFLADPGTSDDRINLSLQQEFRRTTGAADLGAAVVLSGVARAALTNNQDSDLFTIIGSTNVNARYFANASISLYKPAGAAEEGGIKFSTGKHNFITPSTLTERMRITEDGNVLIGLISGQDALIHAQSPKTNYLDYATVFAGGTDANNGQHSISLMTAGNGLSGIIGSNLSIDGATFSQSVSARSSAYISFANATTAGKISVIDFGGFTPGTTTALVKMRLDGDGNFYIGTTTTGGNVANGFTIQNSAGATYTALGHPNGTSSGAAYTIFSYNSGTIGSITQNGTTAVSYNTSSDQRLKYNIAAADDAGSKIDAIQVRKFDWKVDDSHQDYGMVAQELLEVAPEAVAQGETEDDMMGVDYSKLVPMMIKEIQSLRARINALEAE